MQKPFEIIFWVRAALGVFSGLLAGLLGFVNPNPLASLGLFIAIAVYGLSLGVFLNLMKSLPKTEVSKIYTTGLGTFIMIFLFTWILYNTLLA